MKTEIKYGLLLGLGVCVYTGVAHLLGFYTTNIRAGKYADGATIILPALAIFLAVRERRRRQGYLTLFQGTGTGLLVALISFPISVLCLWVYHHYVNPNWLEYLMDYERNSLARAGVGANEIGARLDALRAGNSDFAQIVGGFVGTLVLGLVLSLVISLVLRKKR